MPPGTISILGEWSKSIPLNSEKLTTEFNDPHYTELEDFEFNSRFRNSTTLKIS
jgi:hypothetical protein